MTLTIIITLPCEFIDKIKNRLSYPRGLFTRCTNVENPWKYRDVAIRIYVNFTT